MLGWLPDNGFVAYRCCSIDFSPSIVSPTPGKWARAQLSPMGEKASQHRIPNTQSQYRVYPWGKTRPSIESPLLFPNLKIEKDVAYCTKIEVYYNVY